MTEIKGVVIKGRIELEHPLDLPDGTEVRIPLPESPPENGIEDAASSEETNRILALMDRMEPLRMTEEELKAWEAERRSCRFI